MQKQFYAYFQAGFFFNFKTDFSRPCWQPAMKPRFRERAKFNILIGVSDEIIQLVILRNITH